MKVFKFNEMTHTLVDRKIELIRDVFVELEDDGFNVEIVNGHKKISQVGRWVVGIKEIPSSPNLIYVKIEPASGGRFTAEEQSSVFEFIESVKKVIPKYRGTYSLQLDLRIKNHFGVICWFGK